MQLLPLVVALVSLGLLGLAWSGLRLVRQPLRWADVRDLEPDTQRGKREQRSLLEGIAARMEPWAVELVGPRSRERTEQRLQAAGHPDGVTAESFLARRVLYSVVFGAVGLLLALSGSLFTGLLLAAFGLGVQDLWLRRKVRDRQDELERALPDFLDILAITVEAGVDFGAAMQQVSEAIEGPLGEEVQTALTQMQFGMRRRDALVMLRDRNDSEILAEFITALLQAMELGAPLAKTLRTLAGDLRTQWYQKARREAARAAPRISVVVSFTLVPASMIVIIAAFVISSGFSVSGLTGG